ncbi:MAG: hypothetical protein EOO95_15275 [Pedobacter sp.]|nr:MAG: hypothetical protein EOO95_15275 [Pedobacter sp.]
MALTNEQAKQEAIKKAFKECGYEKLLPLNVNGWVKVKPHQYINSSLFERLKINNHIHSIRPKSLKHLDTNNGWVRIEHDGSNLPTDWKGRYRVMQAGIKEPWDAIFDCGKFCIWHTSHVNLSKTLLSIDNPTHYKPITPELKPIY